MKGVKLPKTRHGMASFNQLVDSAEKIFYLKGYQAATIADICGDASLAVGTFYIYFDDKYSMYIYLLNREKHRIKRVIADRIKNCTCRFNKEREGIKAFIEYVHEKPSCYNIVWESLYIDRAAFIDYYTTFAESYFLALSEDSQELYDVDLLTAAYMLIGISNFVGLKVIFENSMTPEKLDSTVDAIMSILEKGLFLPRGDKK